MSININTEKDDHIEQIYESDKCLSVFNSIKQILEQDKFDIFKLKSSLDFDQKIDQSNKDIEKLIQLRTQGSEQIEVLKEELNKLKSANLQRHKFIGDILNAT